MTNYIYKIQKTHSQSTLNIFYMIIETHGPSFCLCGSYGVIGMGMCVGTVSNLAFWRGFIA